MLFFNLIWLNRVTANNKRTLLHISLTIIGASVLHISHRFHSCRSQRSFGISINSSKLAWTINVLLQFRVCCLLLFPKNGKDDIGIIKIHLSRLAIVVLFTVSESSTKNRQLLDPFRRDRAECFGTAHKLKWKQIKLKTRRMLSSAWMNVICWFLLHSRSLLCVEGDYL